MRHGYPPVWLSAALLALALMWRMVGAPLTGPQLEDIQTPLWQARVLLPTRVARILRPRPSARRPWGRKGRRWTG